MAKQIKLTLDQEQAFSYLSEGYENLFVTGGAGTGKSFLIRHFLRSSEEKIPVLASTGAAAILVGGRTFHSYFGLGIMQGGPELTFQNALQNKRLKKRLRKNSTIIIDEVSMLSASTLDTAERIARALRGADEPWGGLRVICVGDFAQLPPISQSRQKEWAFLGEAWASSGFRTFELKEVMRTEDEVFMRVLGDVRLGKASIRVNQYLNDRKGRIPPENATHLFPRRDQTFKFNLERLNEINEPSHIFETEYEGDSRYQERLRRDAPIPEILELKVGALVMLRMNDPKQRYVNGTTGKIVDIKPDIIVIETETRRLEIEKFTFTVQDEEGAEVAGATNFPINLAYASTIHKIQGSTLDHIHVDLSALWEPGQAYVALSRVRRGGDVTVKRWTEKSIIADPMVKDFYGIKETGEEPLIDKKIPQSEYFSDAF